MAGIYAVMAYAVTQRRKEIGVRVALGATPDRVLRAIIGQGLQTTMVGVVMGVAGALALTRMLEHLLFGVTPTDPVAFASVIAVLVAVSVLASYVPASYATRADPLEALKQE